MKARVSLDYLPDGALPVYPAARWNLVLGEGGDSVIAVTKPKNVIAPLFELTGSTRDEVDAKLRARAAALVASAKVSMDHSGRLYIVVPIRTEAVLDGGQLHLLMLGMLITPTPVRGPRKLLLSSLVEFEDEVG